MRNSLFNKRIPTLLGIILLGVGIATVSYVVSSGALFTIQATPDYAPENIRITNISDTSFTVSFTTTVDVLGTLSYGTEPTLGKVALDDRDQQAGTPSPYRVHHITLKNLSANSEYFFSITASDKTFLDEDKPFQVQTLAPLTSNPPKQAPIVGKATHADGTTDDNIIVFLVEDTTQAYSVLTKEDGSYVLPLNAIRTKDFSSYAAFNENTLLQMLLLSNNASSRATLLASQINPVPPITLSNNYDFTTGIEAKTPTQVASSSGEDTTFPVFSATEVGGVNEPKILSPKQEEGLNDQQPSFEGTALPNEQIEILIESENEIRETITAGASGDWTYRPSEKLEPGEHTITIKTKDSGGVLRTIKRSFTVFAQGSQFTEPSVSPSQTTPTPTPFATPTPTLVATPTATPTIISTSPTSTIVPPPEDPPGSSSIVLSAIIAFLGLSGGLLLFNLTKTTKSS